MLFRNIKVGLGALKTFEEYRLSYRFFHRFYTNIKVEWLLHVNEKAMEIHGSKLNNKKLKVIAFIYLILI